MKPQEVENALTSWFSGKVVSDIEVNDFELVIYFEDGSVISTNADGPIGTKLKVNVQYLEQRNISKFKGGAAVG